MADGRRALAIDEIPDCAKPDCPYKQCLWSDTEFCYPHAKEELGEKELNWRYEVTHKSAGKFHFAQKK
jgi:hypothetical protein